MSNVKLYDTTLRDGAQTEGISFSVSDKLRIAKKLDDLGIHYIEGGWPGANPKDIEFFKKVKNLHLRNSQIAAFGSTRRAKVKAKDDLILKGLIKADTNVITIFGKSWDLHVTDVLGTTLEENLNMVRDSIAFLRSKGKEVIFDAEHFFNGYKADPDYAIRVLKAAEEAGAGCIVLCDTNGGTITSEVSGIVEIVKSKIKAPLGIHAHNDCELAVANSVAAVQAGCIHVQGTVNGYGERCGNANLTSIIPIIKLKLKMDCISGLGLKELTEASRFVSEMSNMKQMPNQPFVGISAFAHKAGVHVNAILKNPKTYEHIEPQAVGNRRRLLISELSGKSAVLNKAKELDIELEKESPKAKKILKMIQLLEHEGYQFESAEASFDLLVRRAMKVLKSYFQLEGFRVMIEKKHGGKMISEAVMKLKVDGKMEHTAAAGDGPVNALDNALRKALGAFYPSLKEMHLSDFKVRVLDEKAGTAAKVRVLIQSQDSKDSWWTVGVSENIIEASWIALVDSIEYKLVKDKVRK
ncbi:MAG: citramalate synthase [Candidatus Omnitrophota bacterium]|nr:citramalate synthase [Candidatus Omnitrophota bacterium]